MKKLSLTIMVLFLIGLCAVVPFSAAEASSTDSIVIAPAADAKTLNPLKAGDSYSLYPIYLIYDPLFETAKDMSSKPVLVTKTETPDDKTYIFTLRKDVKFQDGVPLTAEDVKFTYDYIRNKANGHPYATFFDLIDKIEVMDPYKVKITTREPYAPLLANLNLCIAPKHIAEKNINALDAKPVGSGPYKFVEWKPQDHITLVANEQYWKKGCPKIKNVTLTPISETTTRVVGLESGRIDIADHIPVGQVAALKKEKFIVKPTQPNGYNLIAFNESAKPFNDKRVRQAMVLALNRPEIVKFVWYGYNKLVNGPIIPESWAYDPKVRNNKQDIPQANKLLAEAGYPNGFEFTFSFEADENVKKFVEVANQQWAAVGIRGKLSSKEWGAFFSDIKAGKYQVCAWQSLDQKDPDIPLYRMFHSRNLAPAGYNWHFYKNPALDKVLDAARTTLDKKKRIELYKQAQQILTEDYVDVYLAEYSKYVAMSPRVINFYHSPYIYLRPLMYSTLKAK